MGYCWMHPSQCRRRKDAALTEQLERLSDEAALNEAVIHVQASELASARASVPSFLPADSDAFSAFASRAQLLRCFPLANNSYELGQHLVSLARRVMSLPCLLATFSCAHAPTPSHIFMH